MTSNDLLVTPLAIMDAYRPNLVEVSSKLDSRIESQREMRDALYGADSGIESDEINMRYEPDTKRLYINASWLRSISLEEVGDSETYVKEL